MGSEKRVKIMSRVRWAVSALWWLFKRLFPVFFLLFSLSGVFCMCGVEVDSNDLLLGQTFMLMVGE